MIKLNDKTQKAMKLLSNQFRVDFKAVRINTHNTLPHEISKLKLAYFLIKDNKKVITEAIFKNGGRADIFVPEDMRVFEILHSETKAEAMAKTQKYPEELDILYLDTKEVMEEDFEW